MKEKYILIGLILSIFLQISFISALTYITNCTDLQDMNNNLSENYELSNNVDCSATTGWNGGKGFVTIGNASNHFRGQLNGKNYIIYNLTIYRPSAIYMGIFGKTNNSYILNLIVENINITGMWESGGLIAYNSGNVSNVSVSGLVKTINYNENDMSGGLIAYNFGYILNCAFNGNVTGDRNVGGLIGNDVGFINNSYSMGNVISSTSAGGLVGTENSIISDSYSSSNVYSNDYSGGFVGFTQNSAKIINSYSVGRIVGGGAELGGLVGFSFVFGEECTSSYWDNETSSLSVSGCGEGRTTAQMKQQSNYINWDFNNIWSIAEGIDYPKLIWQNITYIFVPIFTPASWEEVNLDENIVDPNNSEQGLLPSIYYGMATFLSNIMTPVIIIIFVIFFVMIIGTIGVIIKKIAMKI